MKEMSHVVAFASAVVAAGAAQGQVTVSSGEPAGARVLDFDMPQVPLGRIAGNDPAFTGVQIEGVRLVPTWAAGGDVLNAGSNAQGRALVSQNGDLTVIDVGGNLDNPGTGAGFDITFKTPVTAFGALFVDQINFNYDVELFSGGVSAGTGAFSYSGSFPAPAVYWEESSGRPFDRILITSAATGGWGLDNLAVVVAQVTCYPDCDQSTVLDIFDFLCFQDAFVAMNPYANCDGNTVFDIFDFLCFQDEFVKGCP